jgi:hypothetical protein
MWSFKAGERMCFAKKSSGHKLNLREKLKQFKEEKTIKSFNNETHERHEKSKRIPYVAMLPTPLRRDTV